MQIPRPEYPRPQLLRKEWLCLNGDWAFQFDDHNEGLKYKWHQQPDFSQRITVPYGYQSELSGIGDPSFHDVVWYHREFAFPKEWSGRRILLHFGAVDYQAWVWVNGVQVAYHEGGHTPFSAEITDVLTGGKNQIVLRVVDRSTDLEQPRGKQFWEEESKAIFYTRTTGIWQTVWIEPVSDSFLQRIKATPDIDSGEVFVEYTVESGTDQQRIEMEVSYQGEKVGEIAGQVESIPRKAASRIAFQDFQHGQGRLWSPEAPQLYDLVLRLKDEHGRLLDEVKSYIGMRKISATDGQIKLNNHPYYMKLILDQGYFPQGLLTAPSDNDLKKDIELCKEMGFNGARKHQKIEDPRYLYWADHLGFLVWGEMSNCHTYSDKAVGRMMREWQEAVERDYNHPCIVAWVPLNESWGVPRLKTDSRQPNHSLSLYHLTKSLDPTRPVISNDGWELTKFDILSIHDYEGKKEILKDRYANLESVLAFEPSERALIVPGFEYNGEPVFISEFGGIAYKISPQQGWGYTTAENAEDFLQRYEQVVAGLLESPIVQGFCYTQITDVEQEINGLLTYDRKPKADIAKIRKINERMKNNKI